MGTTSVATSDAFAWFDAFAEDLPGQIEIDVDGCIVVTPHIEEHSWAMQQLYRQLTAAAPEGMATMIEPSWSPIPQVICEPDVAVVQRRAVPQPKKVFSFDPPPLLVVEIASPSSRRRDWTEKADLYLAGGALAYWTIEIPGLTAVDGPALTFRRRHADRWVTSGVVGAGDGPVPIDFPFPILVDLDGLAIA